MTRGERGGIFFQLAFLLFLAVLLFILYLLRHPILRAAGEFWVVEDPVQPSEAILVLGDDNERGDRATRAAELYHGHWAPKVVASGRIIRAGTSMAELIERDLESRGVPAAAVVRFAHTADSTREEAQALQRLVVERSWMRILVVTSNYHTRRTRYIFERVMPANVAVRVLAARDSEFDPASWWQNRRGVKIFFHEMVGYPLAWWELRRLKREPAPPNGALLAPALR
jgi:uncharacterized SAM-binding protein YcdF (DUF218 family)